jgi:hypothetical protein
MSAAASAPSRFSAAVVTREPDRTCHKGIFTGRSTIGKTYIVSTIPGVFIIPVEEGLKGNSPDHNPAYFKVVPRNLKELHEALDCFSKINRPGPDGKRPHPHLAIDSLSGVEDLVHAAAIESEGAKHMDSKEYKVVWSATMPLWAQFRDKLDEIRRYGTHVWLIAHSSETVEATDKGETFRKQDLDFRGSPQHATELRRFWRKWADHVFFMDWDATVQKGGKGTRTIGKYTGRVIYTRESPARYAKTRSRIPEKLPATWEDITRAMQAGAVAPEPKLRAQLAEILPQLTAEDRALIEPQIAAAKGPNQLAAILSRAQGMLSVSQEDGATDDASPTESAQKEGEPATPAESAPAVEQAATAELPVAVADELTPTSAPSQETDGRVLALANAFKERIACGATPAVIADVLAEARSAGFPKAQMDELEALARSAHSEKRTSRTKNGASAQAEPKVA